jgi:5-methylcytosine-specific restriction protein B
MAPIPYSTVKENIDLKTMEVLQNPNGSFFKLTKDEYGVLMDLIRESNKSASHVASYEKYTQEDFLEEVFMSKNDLQNLENLLRKKKNIILQGAPGVGKTFCARRLAYELMGEKDESRVSLIQFHQNYSYEDFILGYKPVGSDFELQRGIFYKFCINAANDPDKPYFFIIDEINRGNLSKIFGELLMLIENDYRGEKLTLAYKDEKFFVPKNVHIIGMMNTADRSLAMIDYALRRRFSFFEMHPGFKSDGFKKYQASLANPHFDSLIETIEELNKAIVKDESLGTGFELGHSYFCGQKSVNDAWLQQVINYDILPLLREYWFDNRSEVKKWETKLNSIFND